MGVLVCITPEQQCQAFVIPEPYISEQGIQGVEQRNCALTAMQQVSDKG